MVPPEESVTAVGLATLLGFAVVGIDRSTAMRGSLGCLGATLARYREAVIHCRGISGDHAPATSTEPSTWTGISFP